MTKIGWIILIFLFLSLLFPVVPASADTGKPNIILILLDDLDTASLSFMPKTRELLQDRGVTFENYFLSFPVCCPSRASTLRGQYMHNHRVFGNIPPSGGFEKFRSQGLENSTIATWLNGEGYKTIMFGKYLNRYAEDPAFSNYIPPGWVKWQVLIGSTGSEYFNYQINENGNVVSYGNSPGDYVTDVIARKTLTFLQNSQSEPFFMYIAPTAPHGPATSAPRHDSLFSNERAPRTASFNEDDVSDKPQYVRNRQQFTSANIASIDNEYRRRLRSLQSVDEMVGRLVQKLEDLNKLDETYIFFTSDNGYLLGQHRIPKGKLVPYEESIRVPLIVRGPGIPEGKSRNEFLVGNIDLAPTFAELSGHISPGFVDGRSLVPLLGNSPPPVTNWRQAYLVENGNLQLSQKKPWIAKAFAQSSSIPIYKALRLHEKIYVEYETGEKEIYDLVADREQLENIYSQASPQIQNHFASWIRRMSVCAGESCRSQEFVQTLTGDLTGDYLVNFLDARALVRDFHREQARADIYPENNADALINSLDFALLIKNYTN